MTDILIWALLFVAISILVVSALVLKVVKILVKETLSPSPFATEEEKEYFRQQEAAKAEAKKNEQTLWNKVLGLKPISAEKDLMMDHKFDDIAELDNPTPAWFMFLFYGTIIFAIGYLLNYHVFGYGKLQEDEYVVELQEAENNRIAFLQKPGNAAAQINENNIEQSTDKEAIMKGAALFKTVCTPCHGEHAEGIVGPNLTDEYWLHGGTVKDIFKTIKYGVPDKGMVAWEKSMNAKQISDITNYVLSLKGSNPPGGKEPQGKKQE
ncbi:cytochrome c, mono- and diheme variant [Pedobacter sp. BAL39]|uniref:cbb3-type cytochrome c oxidase N-terminal domain-containing protein n=1 Tax=Pedobacter sp. BAL39 TaxID=391596 RepID=UPI0001559F14|nr:cbb3-type cytochrome c oxidase N-terminal domain-containing protein [Pedobacter sp. BAL39]EDM36792.1 cytochrome c, mono- and diheme variant [Pedobacter sp. BAL39]